MHSARARSGSTRPEELAERARLNRGFRLYGHRGAPKEHPENTLGGFAAALNAGCNALELDVHLSRDGYVVVAHDDTGTRMAKNESALAKTSWNEISRWNVALGFAGADETSEAEAHPPLLSDVLDSFPGVPISVDLKDDSPALVLAVLRVLAHAAAATREVVSLTSFHQRVLRRLRDEGYRGPLGMGPGDILRLWSLPVALLGDLRGRAAQVPMDQYGIVFASSRFIEKAHALSCRVDFWVINDTATAQTLIALGADGIVTDDARQLSLQR